MALATWASTIILTTKFCVAWQTYGEALLCVHTIAGYSLLDQAWQANLVGLLRMHQLPLPCNPEERGIKQTRRKQSSAVLGPARLH